MRLFWKYSCTSRYSCIVPSNICFGCKIQVHLFHFFEVFPGMHRGSSTNKVIFNETHFGKAYGKNPLNSLLPLLLPFHHILSEETSARSTPSQMLLSDFFCESQDFFFQAWKKNHLLIHDMTILHTLYLHDVVMYH